MPNPKHTLKGLLAQTVINLICPTHFPNTLSTRSIQTVCYSIKDNKFINITISHESHKVGTQNNLLDESMYYVPCFLPLRYVYYLEGIFLYLFLIHPLKGLSTMVI